MTYTTGNQPETTDIIIIGGGVIGASIAYSLCKYELTVILLEKQSDVALGATRANSGIVHAGYDPPPGSLMARLNVEGAAMMETVCKDLDVLYFKCGSLLVASGEKEDAVVRDLYARGIQNGVEGLEVLSGDEARQHEPALTAGITSALYAPSAGIVNPWELCIGLSEVFIRCGGKVMLNSEVTAIERSGDGFLVRTSSGSYLAKRVINAAGLYSDTVHRMVAEDDFSIIPSRGEYFLLDKNQGSAVNGVIFGCPTPDTKGVLIARTVHGNMIVGPSSESIADKDDTATTAAKLDEIRSRASQLMPSINFRDNIRNYSGIRANPSTKEFIIREVPSVPGFFEAAGIKSPGLAASIAIGRHMTGLLKASGLLLIQKQSVRDNPALLRRTIVRFSRMSPESKKALVASDSRYGRIVCRCETVTEGEVLDAIHSPIPARTIDAVKRRTAAGLGRCQGGFCGPRIASLLASELAILPTEILQDKPGSYIFTGPTKDIELTTSATQTKKVSI